MKTKSLEVTIGQLRRIADTLEEKLKEQYKNANADYPTFAATNQQICQINIINREGLRNIWELEE